MDDTFTLHYFPFNPSAQKVLSAQNIADIPINATIPAVQRRIKQDMLGVPVALWMPNNAIRDNKRNVLESLFQENAWDSETFCSSLSRVNSDDPLAQILSFRPGDRPPTIPRLVVEVLSVQSLVVPPLLLRASEDEEDDVVTVMRNEFVSHIANIKKLHKSPSVSCQPVQYFAIQDGPARILDGRWATEPNPIPPPIEIYHPAFAAFIAESQNPDLVVPVEFLRRIPNLMTGLSKIATSEVQRTTDYHSPLREALQFGLELLCSGPGGQAHLGLLRSRMTEPLGAGLPLALVEEKDEPGGGNDPCLQTHFAYADYWSSREQQGLVNACYAPSFKFLIGLAGPGMCISAGIYLNSPIFQRLTDTVWVANSHTLAHAKILRIGRIFWALRNAVKKLQEYYDGVSPPADNTCRFYPLATQYRRGEDTIDFEYVGFLQSPGESCAIFLARECGNPHRKIVVKFVERYGDVAHTLLADKGLAPPLLYCGDIWLSGPEQHGCGTRKMVVMEYVEGQTLLDVMPVTPEGEFGPTPAGVYTAVRRAVDALQAHDPPLVHGDMRYINIMIADSEEEESGSVEDRVRIIDFDWAGVAGEEGRGAVPTEPVDDSCVGGGSPARCSDRGCAR